MSNWKEKVKPSLPFLGKLVGSTAGYLLMAALTSDLGSPPTSLATMLGAGGGAEVGKYLAQQLQNLDLYGEELGGFLNPSEHDPHYHVRNNDIHSVVGLTIKTLIEGYIKENPGSLSDEYKQRLEHFWRRWNDLNPSQFEGLGYLQGSNVHKIYQRGPAALNENPVTQSNEDWEDLIFFLMTGNSRMAMIPSVSDTLDFAPLVELCASEYIPAFTYILRHHQAAYNGVQLFLQSELLRLGVETTAKLDQLSAEIRPLLTRPQPRLENFADDADLKDESHSAYLFRRRVSTLYGREVAYDALKAMCETEKKFQWARLTGKAGTGKSRLALELVSYLSKQQEWYAGFLPTKHSFHNWDNWTPIMPTLIVVDYAGLRREFIGNNTLSMGELVDKFARTANQYEHPVRLLLIDRDRKGLTTDHFFDGVSDPQKAKQTEFDLSRDMESPLDLKGTGNESSLAILREEMERLHSLGIAKTVPSDAELKSVLATLENRLKEPARPLFLLFAARALAEGENPDGWSAESLVENILRHEQRHWESVADRDQINGAHINAFCFATLTGDWKVADLADLPEANDVLLPSIANCNDAALNTICSLAGGYDRETIPALLPDLLGEFFVLQRLCGEFVVRTENNIRTIQTDTEKLVAAAWRKNPLFMAQFVERTFIDYGFGLNPLSKTQSKALEKLCERPDGMVATDVLGLLGIYGIKLGKAGASVWALTVASRIAFEYAGRKNFDKAEKAYIDSSESINVARNFASGLSNAVLALEKKDEQLLIVKRIESLYDRHEQDLEIARAFASGLYNATIGSSNAIEIFGIANRIESLHDRHDQDLEIARLLSHSLYNATVVTNDVREILGIVKRIESLYHDHDHDFEVGRQLSDGLCNATAATKNISEIFSIINRIESLYDHHDKNLVIAHTLASSLHNVTVGNTNANEILGIVKRIKLLYDHHDKDLEIARRLSHSLYNATIVTINPIDILGIVKEIEELYREHNQDLEIAQQISKGLYNATVFTEEASKVLAIVRRIEELYQEWEDLEVGIMLLKSHIVYVLKMVSDIENILLQPALENLGKEINRQMQNSMDHSEIIEALELGLKVARRIGHSATSAFESWLHQITETDLE